LAPFSRQNDDVMMT